MSTTTLNQNRRFIRPSKRKEREDGFDALKLSTPPPPAKLTKPIVSRAAGSVPAPSSNNNQLLAGYLAHEFLTKGTLYGQPWDPERAESEPMTKAESRVERHQRYVEVADMLKADGVHLPGVINPTQLGRFLKL